MDGREYKSAAQSVSIPVQPAAAAWRKLGDGNQVAPGSMSRLDLLKALLREGDGALAKKLALRNEARIYAFSSGLTPLPLVVDPDAATKKVTASASNRGWKVAGAIA